MNAQNSSGSGSGNDGGNSNSISNTSTNTNTSGRALLTNSVLHRQVTLIVRALRKSPDDPAICLRALRALLLVLRENGAACCRQYEEALVENMIPPLMAHPEDPALCETALAALAVLSQSPTLPPPEAPLCGLLVYLLERNAEHAKVRYLILCVLNNLALDVFLPNDLRFRLDSAFAALLLGKDCASDPRLCAACLGAICNCSRCVAPATGKLVEAVLGALTNHGGDSAVLCVGAMALGNLVRQGDTAMDAALRFCAVGRIAGLLRGHCRAAVAMTTASSPPSSHLYATLIEVIGDIAAEACARKRESSVAAMEDVVTALLDVLRTRAGGPKAAVQALRALRILCAASPANRAFAVQSSGVEITLGAGKQSPENVALCVGAARALQNMLLLDAAQDVARKAGVVGFAGDALRRLAKLPRACYHFLSLVSSATISGENKKAAGEAGIVDTVVDVIEWYSNKDTRVCEPPLCQEAAIRKGAVSLLAGLLRCTNYRLCTVACYALQQIAACDYFFTAPSPSQITESAEAPAAMGSKNAADNAFRAVVETMNMNSDDSDYCLLASKTLVNITARGSQYKNNNSSSSSSSSVRWRDVVDSAEEALWIHQDKISAYDTMCAVLLNVYARYVHEILPAWDKRALCVCHVVDILRYYRGNPTICAMSVAFLDAMLEESNGGNCSSTGCTPSDEVRFLLWQEGVPKLLGSALMIHEGNTGLYNSINSIIAKIGDHVFSDWLQCIGASKVPYKKEFPFSEVAAMSKSKLMFNGIFYYAVVMDKAARYNLWRSAGFIISKPDSPLYWERFVTTSVATETAPARTIATTEADGSSGEAATESASQSPVRALAPPSGGDGSDSDFNKVYAILLENKEFFASVLGETPEDFTESVEKALRYVSYLLACKETSAKMSAWGLTKSDILAVTFYRLDFASTLLQHSARFSAVLNAFVAQSKASKSTLTPITLFYEALKRALVKIPPYEGKVYRVFLSESRQDLKALAKAGTPFAWNALVSATTNFDAAKRLCININYILAQVHVRRSHRIDLFTPFPALHDECEVLTLPTSAFRVTKDMYWDSENKMYYVDIEEI